MNTIKPNHSNEISASVDQFTNASWNYAHNHLWSNYPFTKQETDAAKKYIRAYYEEILPELFLENSVEKHYEFCIRIILAALYIVRKPGRYITHPVVWFNPENKYGFAGTKEWYTQQIEREQYQNVRFYLDNGTMKKVAA